MQLPQVFSTTNLISQKQPNVEEKMWKGRVCKIVKAPFNFLDKHPKLTGAILLTIAVAIAALFVPVILASSPLPILQFFAIGLGTLGVVPLIILSSVMLSAKKGETINGVFARG